MLGAGGHAKVLLALVQALDLPIKGVCDPELAKQSQKTWRGVPVLGGDDMLERMKPVEVQLINGIGQTIGSQIRKQIYVKMRALGFSFPALIHPAAWIASEAMLAEGVQIMAGCVIQPDCTIGENTIINTRAGIDHDTRIGAHVHIAPGATLCGGVTIGDNAFIAAGATIIPEITVGESAIVGAGVALVHDLPAGQKTIGKKYA